MARKKKRQIWKWVLAVCVAGAGVYQLHRVEVPCTAAARTFIQKQCGPLVEQAGLSFEKVSVDLGGDIHLRNVCLKNFEGICISDVEMNVSLAPLIKRRLQINVIKIDTLSLNMLQLESFRDSRTAQLIREMEKNLNGVVLEAGRVTVEGENRTWHARQIKADITPSARGRMKAGVGIKRIFATDLTPMKFAQFTAEISSSRFSLDDINLKWLGGTIKGNLRIPLDDADELSGSCAFSRLDLDPLSQGGFFKNGVMTGRASGEFLFKGKVKDEEGWNIDGKCRVSSVTMKEFPFQGDLIITQYMPDLAYLEFDHIDIQGLRFRKDKIYLDQVTSQGSRFWFEGKGNVSLEGELYMLLTCHLGNDYYSTLSQTVQDGIVRNNDSIPTFQCSLRGNMDSQHLYVDKVLGRVVKTKVRRLGRKLLSIFQ